MRDARARACPSQARMASEDAGWKRGVAGAATHRMDAGQSCCTSHLPPEIPRPAPRGVLRAAVGRSSDSWLRRRPSDATPVAASQGHRPSANRDRVTTYRCGAVPGWVRHSEKCRPHRLPFSSDDPRASGTDNHNIVWPPRSVNRIFRGSAQTKSGPKPAFRWVQRWRGGITRPSPRLLPRPSSTGGCGPACRPQAP